MTGCAYNTRNVSNLEEGDFGATIETDMEVANVANARVDIEGAGGALEQAQVISIHPRWHNGGTEERYPYLAAVRMTGKNQIEFAVAQPFRPSRIMYQ